MTDAAATHADGSPTAPAPVVSGAIGILGGTFDPIHHGHLAIAEEARETLGLERVLFIPAATPPHKPGQPVTPAADRLEMVRLAIAGNPAFSVSDTEMVRGGASYTVDTLEALAADGLVQPWMIMSVETLEAFTAWRAPERILDLARLAVVPRAGHDTLDAAWLEARFPGRGGRAVFLPGPLLPISGSVVRHRAAVGRSVRYLVPDAVAAYIAQHRLYTGSEWRTQPT